MGVEKMMRDKLDSQARWREGVSWQHRQLRWAVLKGLAAYSPEFCQATATLAATHNVALRLYYHEVDTAYLAVVADGPHLPERLRPPKEWRDTKWAGYLWGLANLSQWFGLAGPRKPQVWEDECRDRWDETLHYFLQEQHKGSLGKHVFGSLYCLATPLSNPLPWLDQPPRRRGRPALDASGQRWKELEVLAHCIAQRLLGQSWEEIGDCDLTTQCGDPLFHREVATRCKRLAKRLQIFRPL